MERETNPGGDAGGEDQHHGNSHGGDLMRYRPRFRPRGGGEAGLALREEAAADGPGL